MNKTEIKNEDLNRYIAIRDSIYETIGTGKSGSKKRNKLRKRLALKWIIV